MTNTELKEKIINFYDSHELFTKPKGETFYISNIGTTKIVAMVGKRNEYGKLEILGIGNAKSLGVKRGVVNNITQTIQSIQHAVSQASAEAGCSVNDVVLGIAGQQVVLKNQLVCMAAV